MADVVLQQAPIWCSTDLRDGNQALVNPMDAARKRRFFDLLVRLGVKEIEVGFPAASKADFDFCRVLVEEGLIPDDTTIAVLTQARPELIERTYEAIEGASGRSSTSTTRPPRRSAASCSASGRTGSRLAVRGAELCKELAGQTDRDRLPVLARELPPHRARVRARDLRGGRGRVGPTPAAKMIVNLPTTVEAFPPNVYADRMEWFIRRPTGRARSSPSTPTTTGARPSPRPSWG